MTTECSSSNSSSSTGIHSFIFSNCFILFRVGVDLEPILGIRPGSDFYDYYCCCNDVTIVSRHPVVILPLSLLCLLLARVSIP